jgi:hypothetical protein
MSRIFRGVWGARLINFGIPSDFTYPGAELKSYSYFLLLPVAGLGSLLVVGRGDTTYSFQYDCFFFWGGFLPPAEGFIPPPVGEI